MGWGIPWVALMLGCKQVMPHRFMDPARLLDLMVTEEVTYLLVYHDLAGR